MNFKIVADSCCDLNDELKRRMKVEIVPLSIKVGNDSYVDDESLDTKELLNKMKNSEESASTACPSPHNFYSAYKGEEENVYVVTLSSALSGTYSSAVCGRNISLEEIGNKFIHVFDSLSASVGETLISMKIFELAKSGCDNIQLIAKVSEYIKEMKTFFVLESLDNLIKSGRINAIKGKIASLLSIKPIMKDNGKGEIALHESVRGSKRALKRLVEVIGEQGVRFEDKILGIAHCNCLEKALSFKDEVLKRYKFKDIVIVETAGISTVYANDGGLIIAF